MDNINSQLFDSCQDNLITLSFFLSIHQC